MKSVFYKSKTMDIPLNIRIRVLRDCAYKCSCGNDIEHDEGRKFKKKKSTGKYSIWNTKVVCSECSNATINPAILHYIKNHAPKKNPSHLRPTMPKYRPINEVPFSWEYFKVVSQNHGKFFRVNELVYLTNNVPWQDLWKAYQRCPTDFVEVVRPIITTPL